MAEPIQIQTAEEIRDAIVAELAAQYGISDTNIGALDRLLAYAVGSELDEMYFQLWRAARSVYIKTATKSTLDKRGSDYSVTRRAATFAVGTVRFTGTNGTGIPNGTIVAAPATPARDKIQFETPSTGAYTIPAAGFLDVPVTAMVAGSESNLADSMITQLETSISGVSSITNPAATTLGTDIEDDDTYRERILATIGGLSRGTIPSIIAGALDFTVQIVTLARDLPAGQSYLEVEEDLALFPIAGGGGKVEIDGWTEVVLYTGIDTAVTPQRITGLTRGQEGTTDVAHTAGVKVAEYIPSGSGRTIASATLQESFGSGLVTVYAHDGSAGGPHAELISLVEKRLQGDGTDRDPGYRGAGIQLSAVAATSNLVNVTTSLVVKASYDLTKTAAEVDTNITAYLNAKRVGQMLYELEPLEVALIHPGVSTVAWMTVNGITVDGTGLANIPGAPSSIIRAGTVTVT